MDMKALGRKVGIDGSSSHVIIRKAQELQRLSNVHFDSASFGVGEVCKSVMCLELACTLLQASFDRQKAVPLSGLSEKAYIRSLTNLQNALGVRPSLDIRELAIQFGCVRIIGTVQKVLALYKQRFVAALPESRRCSADFRRPVFVAVAFYLCARKNKLKADKNRLIEISGSSESEFSTVMTAMYDLCFDTVGVEKEKKDPKAVKGNRDLLDALPSKRKFELSDSDTESIDEDVEVPGIDKPKIASKAGYEKWKVSVQESLKTASGSVKKTKQMPLSFGKRAAVVEPLPSS